MPSAFESFSAIQERHLYGPDGFYEEPHGGPGRDRHFLTSPELGSVFGELLAVAVDRWWREAGSPSEFVFVEAGAGRGTLAEVVLAQEMECLSALSYITVERSAARRAEQRHRLGSSVEIRERLPHFAHVVFANELLDNISVDIARHDGSTWREVLFDDDLQARDIGGEVPLAVAGAQGAHAPVQTRQHQWVKDARRCGRVIAIDYARSTSEMASDKRMSWLRTYRAHGHGHGDVTCDVAVDQLPTADITTQAQWLEQLGIRRVARQASAELSRAISRGGLDSIAARSRMSEIDALCDPTGLGGFTVFQWPPTPS